MHPNNPHHLHTHTQFIPFKSTLTCRLFGEGLVASLRVPDLVTALSGLSVMNREAPASVPMISEFLMQDLEKVWGGGSVCLHISFLWIFHFCGKCMLV